MAWLPYYCRIACSSEYVVLDNVSFRRHFYHDRTYLLDKNNNSILLNLPTDGSQNIHIQDVKLVNPEFHVEKILKTIFHIYKKHKYFEEINSLLFSYIEKIKFQDKLMDTNLLFLKFVFEILNIELPIIDFSSNLTSTTDKNERLLNICKLKNKTKILCGWGVSEKIHDLNLFKNNEIDFVSISKDEFENCLGNYNFIDGISIIDVLMKQGVINTREIFYKCSQLYTNKLNE